MASVTLTGLIDRRYESLSNELKRSILEVVPLLILDSEEPSIARNSGITLSVMLTKIMVHSPGDLATIECILTFLVNNLNSSNLHAIEASLKCFQSFLQEIKSNTENFNALTNETLFQVITPLFIKFISKGYIEQIRVDAFLCLNELTSIMPSTLSKELSEYSDLLIGMLYESQVSVRAAAAQCLVTLCEMRREFFVAHFDKFVDGILTCMAGNHYKSAKAIAFFWDEYLMRDSSEEGDRYDTLEPFLEKIVKVLLEKMVLSEEDLQNSISIAEANLKSVAMTIEKDEEGNEELFLGMESLQESEETNSSSDVTLRTICTGTLAKICNFFRDQVFELLRAKISLMLESSEWTVAEAGILCLGTMAMDCETSIEDTLPKIIPFILSKIDFNEPLLSSTGFSALSK